MTKEIIIRNRVIFITSKSDPKSAYKVDESKQRPQNEFYLSPPSECVEHHLLVEISTKDSCLSESQFFFCLFFWSLRLTALRLDPDSGVDYIALNDVVARAKWRQHQRRVLLVGSNFIYLFIVYKQLFSQLSFNSPQC